MENRQEREKRRASGKHQQRSAQPGEWSSRRRDAAAAAGMLPPLRPGCCRCCCRCCRRGRAGGAALSALLRHAEKELELRPAKRVIARILIRSGTKKRQVLVVSLL